MTANRIVLAGANVYFSIMFNTEMKEKYEQEIQLSGAHGEILEAFVRYCYTGQMKITAENVLDVLSAASMYLFDSIQIGCEKHLIEQLTSKPEFTLFIYEIADKYSLTDLIQKSIQMIAKEFRSLVKTDYFFKLSYPLLERILCSDEKFENAEEEIFEAAMKWVEFDMENRKELISNILKSVRLVHMDPMVMVFNQKSKYYFYFNGIDEDGHMLY